MSAAANGKRVCRWAALSLSTIASTFFQDLLSQEGAQYDHKLVAISTTGSDERAQKWLGDNKIPDAGSVVVYHSWEKMLKEGDFDIVYISTPHPLHYEETLAAIARRRNALVEKPATMTAAQYRKCIAEAEKQKVVLMEAMWTRYLPATRYLQEDLLPRIGDVRRVFSDFSFPIVGPELPNDSRFLDKSAGAGSLLDQGVYALTWADVALNTSKASKADVVHAHTHTVPQRPGDVDDITTVILAGGDATAVVTMSMTLPGSSKPAFYQRLQAEKAAPSVRIEGSEASVAIPFPCIRPEELRVQWYGRDHVGEDGVEREEVIRKPVSGWGIWYQADVIADAVFSGKPQTIGADESLRVLEWMDKARKLAGITYDAKLEQV
ncbi:putative oxido [Cyphellophora attinorum]|uniref:D-xylose 1-dehydrogenase (NADP(+), D-xylono-1,5-lactone-forming) n=1 Tax=Cyphellophora attinorum TaxID=1664694 RepID=A0A0N0NJ04_9EURO|nr:putative oxido [Phialophora attinorum]KPI36049.1 putative oxido [Phialophora attinorum]